MGLLDGVHSQTPETIYHELILLDGHLFDRECMVICMNSTRNA